MKERRNVTYEYRAINTKDLQVDELYQRDIDPKRLARMVKNYDPCLVNAVKVSYRDGKYWIFDGRHTSVMEKTVRGKGRDVAVDCKVFRGLTRLDEMELFVEQNGESAAVSVNAKMKALYNFGDPDITGMVSAAAAAGVRVDFTKGQATNKITAISTLLKMFLRMPRDQFIQLLAVLREAWSGSPDGFVREILIGMEKFYGCYYAKFNPKDLIKCLGRIDPSVIVRQGKAIGASSLASTAYARIILQTYNTGRSKHRLPDEL